MAIRVVFSEYGDEVFDADMITVRDDGILEIAEYNDSDRMKTIICLVARDQWVSAIREEDE